MILFPWGDGKQDEIIIAKNRGGQRGTVPVSWKPEWTRFGNPDEGSGWSRGPNARRNGNGGGGNYRGGDDE